ARGGGRGGGAGADAAHGVHSLLRSPVGRAAVAGAGAVLSRLAMDHDVVALPPASVGGVCGRLPSDPLFFDLRKRVPCPLRAAHAPYGLHLRPTAAAPFLRRPGSLRRSVRLW